MSKITCKFNFAYCSLTGHCQLLNESEISKSWVGRHGVVAIEKYLVSLKEYSKGGVCKSSPSWLAHARFNLTLSLFPCFTFWLLLNNFSKYFHQGGPGLAPCMDHGISLPFNLLILIRIKILNDEIPSLITLLEWGSCLWQVNVYKIWQRAKYFWKKWHKMNK